MENIDTLIAAAQSVVDGLTALKNITPAPTVTEVKVEESNGSETVLEAGSNA